MGRKSKKAERRIEILEAFSKVLADHGYAGATTVSIANEANLAPGLIHHYFKNKQEMLSELLKMLIAKFRIGMQLQGNSPKENLVHLYVENALSLNGKPDKIAAKCWVGIFAEGLKDPKLFQQLKRHLDSEIKFLMKISQGKIESKEAAGILSYIIGSLVFGAYAPQKTIGFAFPIGQQLIATLAGD